MGEEPSPSAADSEECPPPQVAGEEKGRRKVRKPPESKTLPTTEAGEKVADQVRRKLGDMVDAIALTEANRRRATAIDSPDYESGFDQIANPSRRQKAVVIVADVVGAIGSALIGYSVNIYTGSASSLLPGHIAFVAGATMTITGIILKYAVPAR